MGGLMSKLRSFFATKKLDIILVGVENSGKTTLLKQLAQERGIESTVPTVGLNVKKFNRKGVNVQAWDLGGHERYRTEWARYTIGCDAVLFLVDGNDLDRLETAKMELHRLLENPSVAGIPVCVVVNKIDLSPCVTGEEAIKALNLDYITDNPWAVVPCSALHGTRLEDVLDWLMQHKKRKK